MREVRLPLYSNEEMLPICKHTRNYLIAKQAGAPLNSYFKIKAGKQARKMTMPIGDHEEYLDHILDCPKCQQWIKEVYPEEFWKRSEGIAKYCCAGFYCAVEEYNKTNRERIYSTLHRGEDPVWVFGSKGDRISFCPWCGSRLRHE